MLRIGIAGLGFMGRRHFDVYRTIPAEMAKVVAVADQALKNNSGDARSGGTMPDLSGIRQYSTIDELVRDPDIDFIDVTMPTPFHREATIAALSAGKHVACEKPMAQNYEDCKEMMQAAKAASRQLYVSHSLRFWPAYARAAELVMGGELGKTLTARFVRFAPMPSYGWYQSATDLAKSGGAALDLHIHEADFVSYLYGQPRAVTSFIGNGGRGNAAGIDHIATFYGYDDGRMIFAEGGWEYAGGHPFLMTFTVHMEKGTLTLNSAGILTLYRDNCEPTVFDLQPGDGWEHELNHFVVCAAASRPSSIISCDEAAFAVKLVRTEIESAMTGKTVRLVP